MIENVLNATCAEVNELLKETPLSFMNESVFRFLFVKNLLRLCKECNAQIEWRRFDLLIKNSGEVIIIEFKFYSLSKSHDLDGKRQWSKGGPSSKNFREFQQCLEKLSITP